MVARLRGHDRFFSFTDEEYRSSAVIRRRLGGAIVNLPLCLCSVSKALHPPFCLLITSLKKTRHSDLAINNQGDGILQMGPSRPSPPLPGEMSFLTEVSAVVAIGRNDIHNFCNNNIKWIVEGNGALDMSRSRGGSSRVFRITEGIIKWLGYMIGYFACRSMNIVRIADAEDGASCKD